MARADGGPAIVASDSGSGRDPYSRQELPPALTPRTYALSVGVPRVSSRKNSSERGTPLSRSGRRPRAKSLLFEISTSRRRRLREDSDESFHSFQISGGYGTVMKRRHAAFA